MMKAMTLYQNHLLNQNNRKTQPIRPASRPTHVNHHGLLGEWVLAKLGCSILDDLGVVYHVVVTKHHFNKDPSDQMIEDQRERKLRPLGAMLRRHTGCIYIYKIHIAFPSVQAIKGSK